MSPLPLKLFSFMMVIALAGCTANNNTANQNNVEFNHELYDGKPTLGLTGEFPPETAEEAIVRGDNAYMAGDPDLALYEYIRAVSFPSQKKADQAFYKIGYIHHQRKNYALAKLAYARAALIKPNSIQYTASVGVVSLQLGEHDNARKQLLKAVMMDQERQGITQFDPDTTMLSQPLKMDGQSPFEAYIALGILTDLDANHQDAQKIYLTALDVNNRSEKALTNLGYSYYLDGKIEQAEMINRRTSTLYPNNQRAWSNLGLTYIKAKRYEDALDALSKVMNREKALNDIGYFAMLEGDYESAIDYLNRAINTSPTFYAKAHENLQRAQKLQITAPPVKLTNERRGSQSQATVFSITDTTH